MHVRFLRRSPQPPSANIRCSLVSTRQLSSLPSQTLHCRRVLAPSARRLDAAAGSRRPRGFHAVPLALGPGKGAIFFAADSEGARPLPTDQGVGGLPEYVDGEPANPLAPPQDLTSALRRHRNLDDGPGAHRLITTSRTPPTLIDYNLALAACAQSNHLNLATSLLAILQSAGHTPNRDTHTAMLEAFAKAGEPQRARKVLAAIQRDGDPNAIDWGAVVDAHVRAGDMEGAVGVEREARAEMGRMDSRVLAPIVRAFLERGNVDRAVEILDAVSGGAASGACPPPHAGMYNVIIAWMTRNQRKGDADRLLVRMQEEGVEPNAITYGTFIVAEARLGHMKKAWGLVSRMRRLGIPLSVEIFASLITGHAQKKDLNQAYGAFDELVREGLHPNSACYGPLINAHARAGEFDAAHALLAKMEEMRIPPEAECLTGLMQAHALVGDMASAESLLARFGRDSIRPTSWTLMAIVDGHMRCGNIAAGIASWRRLRALHTPANAITYNMYLRYLIQAGEIEVAQGVAAEAVEKGVLFDVERAMRLWEMVMGIGQAGSLVVDVAALRERAEAVSAAGGGGDLVRPVRTKKVWKSGSKWKGGRE
ncbi:hypothetical protein BDK51DRAFT_25790 [Blyttiomyces helicus]|uniref:Pentatricopeptide repeat-containing protein-mitochondrial domain-containing protein n=1 Tax=Blyttiomyces helicus TaxID=388810 RepID=A0A4P9W7C7_9FUNG|nr:hypothetical protein BDK51DRAFT_25790 [Blyttiomyces helicus]|eukprot:RKO87303.1 hypothetical protein BDK51DRAFT_25790 [Blyttiomyces helicus]